CACRAGRWEPPGPPPTPPRWRSTAAWTRGAARGWLRQPHALEQPKEPWISAKRIEHRLHLEIGEPAPTLRVGPLEPLEGGIRLAQRGVHHRERDGRDVALPRPGREPLEDGVRLIGPAPGGRHRTQSRGGKRRALGRGHRLA